jgi:hypothetical protein
MVAKNFKDLTGQKFGKLTVLHRCENDMYGRAKWFCKCDCGGFRKVISYYLTKGTVSNCGCRKRTKPLTNYQKIKQMSIDEIAEWIKSNAKYECDFCKGYACDNILLYSEKCVDGIKQWLLQEVEE